MSKSNIEWTERTWNPVSGCTKISDGCANCWAEKMAKRLSNIKNSCYDKDEPFKVSLHPDRLDKPLKRKKPTTYFVCSMGDLFHDDVPFEFINKVFETMVTSPQHTFQVLTKRPERMKEFFNCNDGLFVAPLDNVLLGVTAENQEQADKRIPILLKTPAVKLFVSIEPMLGAIDLDGYYFGDYHSRPEFNYSYRSGKRINWIIVGGESGANARPMHSDWVRSIRNQCKDKAVPFFFKQMKDGKKLIKMPLLDGVEHKEVSE